MANVFNMGGGTDLVNATLKPGNKIVYSDGLEYHSEIPTEEKIVPVLGSSVVYAPYGLTGEVTALADQGFWFVTGDFISQSSVPTASLEPVSGVTYTDGIADLDPSVVNDIARAISNNSSINYTTEVVYIDLATMHRKISVGDEVQIQFGNALYQFRIIGFNSDVLADSTVYGSATATGTAGFTLEMVNVYDQASYIWVLRSNSDPYIGARDYNPDSSLLYMYQVTLPSLKETIPSNWRTLIKSVKEEYYTSNKTVPDRSRFSVDLFFHTSASLNLTNTHTYLTRVDPYAYYKTAGPDKWKKTLLTGVASAYLLDDPYTGDQKKYLPVNGVSSDPTESDPMTTYGSGSNRVAANISPLFCI